MRKDDLIRVQHMLDAAKEAVSFASNRTRADLDRDRMLTLSIVKSVEIIGEAASKVTDESRHLKIPSSALFSNLFPRSCFFDSQRATRNL